MDLPTDIQIGISACVTGEEVRYDGGHKRDRFVSEELSRHVEFLPICPEMAIGMGTPREPIRLVGDPSSPRLLGVNNPQLDASDAMHKFSAKQAANLGHLSGYILCAKSPSCGMERVPVYSDSGNSLGKVGVGLFAQHLMTAQPLLPIEENGRLNDIALRENFIMRVVAYARWQQILKDGLSQQRLLEFHRRHKFLLLAHNQSIYRQLGPLAAGGEHLPQRAENYIRDFMAALKSPASISNHRNALLHIQGFLKKHIGADEKAQLGKVIEDYANGILPLLVPLEMLQLFLRRHQISYLLDQYYFEPYPRDLKLRIGL